MSGWLVAKVYEGDAGLPTHEALFAVWHEDQQEALRLADAFSPRGSGIRAHIVAPLSESMLRGLRLRRGEAAVLHADRPWI